MIKRSGAYMQNVKQRHARQNSDLQSFMWTPSAYPICHISSVGEWTTSSGIWQVLLRWWVRSFCETRPRCRDLQLPWLAEVVTPAELSLFDSFHRISGVWCQQNFIQSSKDGLNSESSAAIINAFLQKCRNVPMFRHSYHDISCFSWYSSF